MTRLMILRLILFLVINFAALGIGSVLMGPGAGSDWYQNLIKAPWTPPGWVFGAAWTLIMICFAIYMTYAWDEVNDRNTLILLFTAQWPLNVLWNPVFFRYHQCAAWFNGNYCTDLADRCYSVQLCKHLEIIFSIPATLLSLAAHCHFIERVYLL